MATIDVEARPRGARGLAVLSLAVVAGSIALVATRGVLPLDESIQGRLGELALGARERLGTRGVLTFIFDAFFHIAFDAAIGVVAIAQGLLALFLVLSSVAVLWGDWISLWSMRRWAAIALGVECLNLALVGGQDLGSWLRVALALVLLAAIGRPPEPEPVPIALSGSPSIE